MRITQWGQGMIDHMYQLAFEGSVERIYPDSKLVQNRRQG
jgi:hypothetical protein